MSHEGPEADREPSIVRSVRRVWREDPPPPFSRPNGVALGLMLLVDLLFGVALCRGASGGWSTVLLVLYAAGLTVGVARVRAKPELQDWFGLILTPVCLQISVYLLFWADTALLDLGDGVAGLSVVALLFFFFGWVIPVFMLPFTRRLGVLGLAEAVPPLTILLQM